MKSNLRLFFCLFNYCLHKSESTVLDSIQRQRHDTIKREATVEQDNFITIDIKYDFIVVGAGSAGIVVANRLSEVHIIYMIALIIIIHNNNEEVSPVEGLHRHGLNINVLDVSLNSHKLRQLVFTYRVTADQIHDWKVLLIEAGQDEEPFMDIPAVAGKLQTRSINWKYTTVPMTNSCLCFEDHRCKFPRGKVMGGSSTLNYMIYTRGNKLDYDNWAGMGNTGWSYDDVLKYFIRSENANISDADQGYHGQDGLLSVTNVPYRTLVAKAFVDAGSQIGLPIVDVNGENQVGINYIQVTMKDGRRCSTNTAFLLPTKMRLNLHVKKYSTVTRIIIEKNTKKAIGVEYVSNHKKYRVFVSKEVIISGGTINSPQLLMLSGIGPKEHLKELKIPLVQNLPVGENLMDHVALGSLSVLINDTISLKTQRVLRDPLNLYNFLMNHNGPLTIPGGAEALAFFDLDQQGFTGGHPNLELLLVSGLYSSDELAHKLFGLKTDIYNKIYKPTENMDGFTIFPMIMRPKSKGRMWLEDANPFHHPLIDPNYFDVETDLDVAVAGVRIVQQMLETDAMKKLNATLYDTPLPGCVQHKFDTDAYWKCSARQISFTIYHLSGTCKMGPVGDHTAVVDPRLRVHGVSGLRVIDASVMPEIPAAHINAPTIMIGEKGADMIKEDWGFRI